MLRIESDTDAGVAVVTLCDSDRGNLLNGEGLTLLARCLAAAQQDPLVRVVVLRSNGATFCNGMDLRGACSPDVGPRHAREAIARYVEVLTGIYTGPKPVICLVNGDVKAGGVGLACACDIVLATPQASFQFSEVYWGLIPANVMPFILSRRVAPQTVRYLVLTAKNVAAQEAKRLHLVDEVFSGQDMGRELKAIIKNLMRASPKALAETKRFTALLDGEKLAAATALAQEKLLEQLQDPAVVDAIGGLDEGRTPPWFAHYRPQSLVSAGGIE